jgi:hypothetical protein
MGVSRVLGDIVGGAWASEVCMLGSLVQWD